MLAEKVVPQGFIQFFWSKASNCRNNTSFKQGRAIFAGSNRWLFNPKGASQTKFQANVINWLANGKSSPKIAFNAWFRRTGFKTAVGTYPISRLSERGIADIYCMKNGAMTDQELNQLVAFIERGGSVLFADHAFSFSKDLVKRTMEWPGNR